MFGPIGTMELVVILVIALIVFGPRKLPELGKSLGKSLGEFKRASNDLRNTLEEEIHVEEQTRHEPPKAAPAPATSRRPERGDQPRHTGKPRAVHTGAGAGTHRGSGRPAARHDRYGLTRVFTAFC